MTRSPDEKTAETGRREWPVAYCPPGRRTVTAIALRLAGYDVERVAEHPWLTSGVVLAADPGELVPEPDDLPLFGLV